MYIFSRFSAHDFHADVIHLKLEDEQNKKNRTNTTSGDGGGKNVTIDWRQIDANKKNFKRF